MNPIYPAAAVALACVAWVTMRRQPELDLSDVGTAGDVSTDDGEGQGGTWADMPGALVSQAQSLFTPSAWSNPTKISANGLQALTDREGFSATPYPDHKGYSIGYGHLIKAGEDLAYVTRDQAAELLASDVAWAEDAVRSAVLVTLNQDQFDALVSFAFNVGAPRFKSSTLVKRINAQDAAAAEEFGRWVYASGVVNPVLVARRAAEADQFNA